jgi:hypothetical protein
MSLVWTRVGISHWCSWSPVSPKRQEFLGSNPDFFGIFRPEKAQIQLCTTAYPGTDKTHRTPKTHRHGLRHTQDTPTPPIQAQTHPRFTGTAYPGKDTPKTHRHGLSRHRHTQDTHTQDTPTDTPKTHPLPSAHGCQDSQRNGSIGAYPVERIV